MTGESACRLSVTSVSSTATVPTRNCVPSLPVSVKRAACGRRPAVSSSASLNTTVTDVPAAGTLADCGSGPRTSGVVAVTSSEGRLRPASLIANTR